jgi:hypothetical protein
MPESSAIWFESDSFLPALRPLLIEAEENRFLKGYVKPSDVNTKRVVIKDNNILIGFFTPRAEADHYRIGALYICPQFRKKVSGFSIAESTLRSYFGQKKIKEITDQENYAATSLMMRLGLLIEKKFSHNQQNLVLWSGNIIGTSP